MNQILIIRFSSLGDVILAMAVIDAVHQLWPESKQTFVVKKEYADVLKHNPYVDEVIALGKGERGWRSLLGLGRRLTGKKIDLVLDLQGGPRGHLLAGRVGARNVARPRSYRMRRMLMAARPGLWRKRLPHVVERYLECLKPWANGNPPAGRPEVYLTPSERAHALELVEAVEGSALVALCPGAKWPAKQWPEKHFAQLGRALVDEGLGVLLLGSSDEKALLEEVAAGISRKEHVMVVADDLRLLASVLAISAAAVCNDSGLMHLSAAVDTPTIAIFGATAPHLGFRPFGDIHKVLWLELDCSPCSLHGEKPCRKGDEVPCMSLLDSDRVLAELRRILVAASVGQGSGSEAVRRNSQCGT